MRPQVTIPKNFPEFYVPGYEHGISEIRELYWIHYDRIGDEPLPTLWDEWLPEPLLWPATSRNSSISEQWRKTLLERYIDPEGYVSTHQHYSVAHQAGWPFPFWHESEPGTWGWHFRLEGGVKNFTQTIEKNQEGWTLENGKDMGIGEKAWDIKTTAPDCAIVTPNINFNTEQSPFIQMRWCAEGLKGAQPYVQWATEEEPFFCKKRIMYFNPANPDSLVPDYNSQLIGVPRHTMIPLYKHPLWKGKIVRLRICFGNIKPGIKIHIRAIFTQYDTRHNINNQNFIRGSVTYFKWTGDLTFLRMNIQRMRYAMQYMMTELGGKKEKCIATNFVGHNGKPGATTNTDGTIEMHYGHGIGNNYYDLLPMGYKDCYATIQYYSSLNKLAEIETEINRHPEWNISGGTLYISADELFKHAQEVKEFSSEYFWNNENKRFISGFDIDGKSYDYGYVFLNLEATYYDFATSQQAEDILKWISGDRIIEGDTSQGEDIYKWRFGPRISTKRNTKYYGWYWFIQELPPWGDQIQDGGCVLGFSYYDLVSRIKYYGANNCWNRLKHIIRWYTEVQEEGGPREYYKNGTRGKLQGGGPPGGLGVDQEFYESILVPQIVIFGFMGFKANINGFTVDPNLPDEWPSLHINHIRWHDKTFSIEVTNSSIDIKIDDVSGNSINDNALICAPDGCWSVKFIDRNDKEDMIKHLLTKDEGIHVNWNKICRVIFERCVN